MIKKPLNYILLLSALFATLYGCTTVIGGDKSTATTSGSVGPATIADIDTTLKNDTISNISIYGNFTADNLTVTTDLYVKRGATLNKTKIKRNASIGGNLTASASTFSKALEFGGTTLLLSDKSRVNGNIISTNPNPVTITIDKSTVDGNIGFASQKGIVILRNKGTLKGKLINGTLTKEFN